MSVLFLGFRWRFEGDGGSVEVDLATVIEGFSWIGDSGFDLCSYGG